MTERGLNIMQQSLNIMQQSLNIMQQKHQFPSSNANKADTKNTVAIIWLVSLKHMHHINASMKLSRS